MSEGKNMGVTPSGSGHSGQAPEPHSSERLGHSVSVPNATRAEVLDELRRRDPERYGKCLNLSFTPGPEWDGSVEQIADAMQAVDREMANPYRNCAARLGGEAMVLRDSARQQYDIAAKGYVPLTREQKRAGELALLMEEASSLLREAASAIEARRAETATEIGGSVHESAVPKADAQTPEEHP